VGRKTSTQSINWRIVVFPAFFIGTAVVEFSISKCCHFVVLFMVCYFLVESFVMLVL